MGYCFNNGTLYYGLARCCCNKCSQCANQGNASGGSGMVGPVGPQGPTGPQGAPGGAQMVTYDASKANTYKAGQLVSYNGAVYAVGKDSPTGTPGFGADYIPISGPAGRTQSSVYDPAQASQYVRGQLVVYNNVLYVADRNGPSGTPGTTGANYTALSSDIRSARDLGGSYVPVYDPSKAPYMMQGELVVYNGALYRAGKNAPSGVPGSSPDYTPLSGGGAAAPGATGATGATGAAAYGHGEKANHIHAMPTWGRNR